MATKNTKIRGESGLQGAYWRAEDVWDWTNPFVIFVAKLIEKFSADRYPCRSGFTPDMSGINPDLQDGGTNA